MQRYAKKSILRVLWRPSRISSKYYCYTCKKKWNPIFFLSRSYSEPESVAKSILTSKKSEITNGPALFGADRHSVHLMSGLLASSVNLSVCSLLEIGFGRACRNVYAFALP